MLSYDKEEIKFLAQNLRTISQLYQKGRTVLLDKGLTKPFNDFHEGGSPWQLNPLKLIKLKNKNDQIKLNKLADVTALGFSIFYETMAEIKQIESTFFLHEFIFLYNFSEFAGINRNRDSLISPLQEEAISYCTRILSNEENLPHDQRTLTNDQRILLKLATYLIESARYVNKEGIRSIEKTSNISCFLPENIPLKVLDTNENYIERNRLLGEAFANALRNNVFETTTASFGLNK